MLKSKVLSVVVALVIAGAFVGAQASQSQKIKKVRQQIEFSSDVKVGSTVLKKGYYQVTSNDNQELTFRRLRPDPAYGGQWIVDSRQTPVLVKCTVSVLDAKSDSTRVEVTPGNGVPTMMSLTFEGTSIKFTIVP